MTEAALTYCEKHPDRETGLRCNRCGRYMCASCAVKTPTGYRCRECVQEQSKVYDTAKPQDYVIALVVAGVLGYIGGIFAQFLGFWMIFLAPAIGGLIGEAVRRAVGKRRSKVLFRMAAAGVILGGLLTAAPYILAVFLGSLEGMAGLLWPGVYVFLAASTAYASLSGIRFVR